MEMKYTSLGRTGMQVSRLCLGGMMFGQRTLAQLQDNLRALAIEITEAERQRIDALAPPGGALAKLPN